MLYIVGEFSYYLSILNDKGLLMLRLLILGFLSVQLFGGDLFLNKFFNKKQCNQVLKNGGHFKTCYSYKNKGALFVAYTLKGNTVNEGNIKKRPRFYDDENIPKKYRSTYSDYTHNSYKADRGHLAPDASFDSSNRSLGAVYAMSNIIPQHRSINRSAKAWMGLERYGRTLAVKMGEVKVLNGVKYTKYPRRIGRNKIAVPKAFWKMYYSEKYAFKKCFYFENKPEVKGLQIKDYQVQCSSLF